MKKYLKDFTGKRIPSLTQDRWIGLFLIILTLSVYAGLVGNDFVRYDDHEFVTRNDHIQQGLSLEGMMWAFTTVISANWNPVTFLSHMLDCQIYGLSPAGHHLTSLFLHVATVLLLFLMLREATGRIWESATVAALFALHPIHVESVAWVSERKDVLSGFFCLLTILMYVHYVKDHRTRWYWLSIVFFTLGLLSKPMLVTIPLLLFIMDYWPLGRIVPLPPTDIGHTGAWKGRNYSHLRKIILEKIPFLVLSLLFGITTIFVQSRAGTMATLEALPLPVRFANALISYQNYLGNILYPTDLAIFYPHSLNMPSGHLLLGACLVLAGITIFACLFIRQQPFLLAGWLWYLVALLPVIGIIQVGFQAMADRYAYLPAIGIYILFSFGLSTLTRRLPYRPILLGCLAMLAFTFLSIHTVRQVGYWKDTKTLFSQAIMVTPNNWLAHGVLSGLFLEEGNASAAEAEARKALALAQNANGHINLAAALHKTGRLPEAMDHLREALRIDPKQAQAYINMGRLLVAMQQKELALSYFLKAEEFLPRNSWAYNILGIAYASAAGYNRAMIQFNKALQLAPQRWDTYNNIGMVYNYQQQPHKALPYLLRAIELQPSFAEAYNNAGVALLKMKNYEKAAYYFSAALMLQPDYEKARSNLYLLANFMMGCAQ